MVTDVPAVTEVAEREKVVDIMVGVLFVTPAIPPRFAATNDPPSDARVPVLFEESAEIYEAMVVFVAKLVPL